MEQKWEKRKTREKRRVAGEKLVNVPNGVSTVQCLKETYLLLVLLVPVLDDVLVTSGNNASP